jgi:4-hydroxybenzoate polyprenyltransferase
MLAAALRIVAGVIVYRLRKLEMFNLAGAGSIAVALHLPVLDIAARTAFCFVANALVYLNNDYIDLQIDLNSADKDASKARFLADNKRAALFAQFILLGLLVVAALLYDPGLLVPLIAGVGICVWYSASLKRKPFVDIIAMMIWGVAMPLCGSPVSSELGWLMALQLGLFSGVFETIQVMRDADADAAEAGVNTTGVYLGTARTLWLARALMLLCVVYALLVLQPWAAAVLLIALLLPFTAARIEQYWNRVKLTYVVAWLIIFAWIFFRQQRAGLLG